MTQKYLRNTFKESVHYASTPTLYYDHHQAAQVNNHSQKYSSTLYLSTSDNSDLSSENNDLVLGPADLRKAETSLKGNVPHCLKITPKCLMQNSILAFSINFCPIKITLFDRKVQVFKNSSKWIIFGIYI